EPVGGAAFQPQLGNYLVFSQDSGGSEFFQFHRFDLGDARATLLTDGESRNTGARLARSGHWLAYASTRRTGRDNDLHVMDPAAPATDRRILELSGGGWSVLDWSPDESRLLVQEYVSINESYLHLVDVASGTRRELTPRTGERLVQAGGRFTRDGKAVIFLTDRGGEFRRLARLDLDAGAVTVLTPELNWDVEAFDLSPDGRTVAYTANEAGASVLHLLDLRTGRARPVPRLPSGVVGGLTWHPDGRELGFTLSAARSPGDAYSFDARRGTLTRWTDSETGGLDAARFAEPELIRTRSFDGLEVSGFLYRPDPQKFPGPRPVLVSIHGGPEAQSRPGFLGRWNFLMDELGIALLYPNVRGSAGFGKTFLQLDNGMLREDSVRDIGAFLDWIAADPGLHAARAGVYGGSYGGYMVLASLIHHGDRLRMGIDVVGISSFVTFLRNTQDYRRDLRRAEYGDERDPAMAAFLERISPLTQADRIRRPLFVVQGQNDPRVPVTEAEQIVRAVRGNGGDVWYLLAKDEGHGFQKKRNVDAMFLAIVQFLQAKLVE
ncbi:MAG TPA: prolyl oligopeptidase family serine peptidase, partial [Verrucomicrobiota bacterium]|nr:prolyl oligopeptidase family serine peptidase [Verrucomicrobiota bacterium]